MGAENSVDTSDMDEESPKNLEEETALPRKPSWERFSLAIVLKFLISQWQILGIGLAVILAWLFPNVGRKGGVIESQYTISYGAIGIIFLVSGLSIPIKTLVENCTKWRLHLVVQVTSFLVVLHAEIPLMIGVFGRGLWIGVRDQGFRNR
jgi:sodium/bile acid cotransporter 7